MSSGPESLTHWLIDYYAWASVLLLSALVGLHRVRQPVRRLAVAWATTVGLVLLAVLAALPNWPRCALALSTGPVTAWEARHADNPRSLAALLDQVGAQAPRPALDPQGSPPAGPAERGVLPDAVLAPHTPMATPPLALAAPPASVPRQTWTWMSMGAGAFLFGSLAMLGWLALGALQTRRLCRHTREAPLACRRILWRLAGATPRVPALRLCDRVGQPVALGVLRPTILLPARLVQEVSERHLEIALAHEWAHIRRGDLWLLALTRCLLPVLFAHPLYWWLRGRLRIDQETLADADAAVANGPLEYADTLLCWARLHTGRRYAAAVALWERPSQLKQRIAFLLDPDFRVETQCPRSWRGGPWLVGMLTVLCLSALTFRPVAAVRAEQAPASTPEAAESSAVQLVDRFDGEAVAANQELRYGWKAGATHVYHVRIEAETGDHTDFFEGDSFYTVRAVEKDQITLVHRGRLFPLRRTKQGMPLPLDSAWLMGGNLYGGVGAFGYPGETELRVDASGRVLRQSGAARLPFSLGELSRLVLEPLSPDGKETWKQTNTVVVEETEKDTARPPFGPPDFGRPPFGPIGLHPSPWARTTTTAYQAKERISYTLGDASGDLVTIKKKYELKTLETIGDLPRLQLVGEGAITFDGKEGLPRALQFHATLSRNSTHATLRTPLTLNCKLLEGAERERALNPPPPPKVERKPLTAAEVTQGLQALTAPDYLKRKAAAERFAQAEVPAPQAEVAKALEPLLADRDQWIRIAAAKALEHWGGKDHVPALLRLLTDEAHAVRWAVLEVLGRLRDERAAEPLAERLLSQDRGFASRALQAMGPIAETAVLKQLACDDRWVRLEVCKVLQVIGTTASVPALETATNDANALVVMAAKDALKAIAARGEDMP